MCLGTSSYVRLEIKYSKWQAKWYHAVYTKKKVAQPDNHPAEDLIVSLEWRYSAKSSGNITQSLVSCNLEYFEIGRFSISGSPMSIGIRK